MIVDLQPTCENHHTCDENENKICCRIKHINCGKHNFDVIVTTLCSQIDCHVVESTNALWLSQLFEVKLTTMLYFSQLLAVNWLPCCRKQK